MNQYPIEVNATLPDTTVELASIIEEEKEVEVLPNIPPPAPTNPSVFREFYNDQSCFLPKDKIRMVLVCAMCGIVDGFFEPSLKEPPFSSQNYDTLKPTIAVVKLEIKRRDPRLKGTANVNIAELMKMLRERNDLLSDECIGFIRKEFDRYKTLFQNHQE